MMENNGLVEGAAAVAAPAVFTPAQREPLPPAQGGAATEASATPPPRSLSVSVGELVLHGFNSDARGRIVAAMEAELERLFGEHGDPAGDAVSYEIDGGSFFVRNGESPEQAGVAIARGMFTRIRRG